MPSSSRDVFTCDDGRSGPFQFVSTGQRGTGYEQGFDLMLRPERLAQPLTWREPRMVFVNSMSDLFHKEVPPEYVGRVFDTMEEADWHTFQVLTKRSSILRRLVNARYRDRPPPRHIWLGVSVEDARCSLA